MPAWRIEVVYKSHLLDPAGEAARQALHEASLAGVERVRSIRGTLLPEHLSGEAAGRAAAELLCDPIAEEFSLLPPDAPLPAGEGIRLTIRRRPGVQDPVAASTRAALADLGIEADRVATYRSFQVEGDFTPAELQRRAARALANEVIEEVMIDQVPAAFPVAGGEPRGDSDRIPLRKGDDEALARLSTEGCLSLTLEEMRTIREHYRGLGREPTQIELETLAQTWSEHCKHKTLTARIAYKGRVYDNLLKETIAAVTRDLDREWCRSVFVDNAGVVDFDDHWCLAIKVETHNHPSAIEPFGGAGTGIGGVIRDIMGTGLGARPVANLDVFCFAPPDTPREKRPAGSLHPLRVLKGVVAGVRDYGNPMGIPTVNGSIAFDRDFAGNPLVYCGCVGVLPRECVTKEARPGDVIVVAGGATGRDGIHGATFSSIELTHESEVTSSGAVQIGDPIMEKKVLEAQLRARDEGLYRCVTDCGAGGLSSAVGEMGERVGARVELSRVPLKYEGLAPWEIWVSEAQERMVMAVPPAKLDRLVALFAAEEVEATPIGTFGGGNLVLEYGGKEVGELDMHFLHRGVPKWELEAAPFTPSPRAALLPPPEEIDPADALHRVLADPNVASKEWVIRQYDHEVQGGSAAKPLCGSRGVGPADAALVTPFPGQTRGFALGHGLQVELGRIDPGQAAVNAVDEALRNLVAAGADPDRVCLLDNFCWGNPRNPELLGSLVEATLGACRAARAFRTPFVSGKDSLNNEFRTREGELKAIPGTLLITALGIVADVRKCRHTAFPRPGLSLWLVGGGDHLLGGSIYLRTLGLEGGGPDVPRADLEASRAAFDLVHKALQEELLEAVHDLSEGGLGAALAECCFGEGVGARVDLDRLPRAGAVHRWDRLLFSEDPGRFLLALDPAGEARLRELAGPLTAPLGTTLAEPELVIERGGSEVLRTSLERLERSWREPLDLEQH